MSWLYRLQSRLNLTGAEGAALVVLALALAGGAVARHVVAGAAPPPPALYAAADTTSATGTAAPAGVPLVTPVVAVPSPDSLAPGEAPASAVEAFAAPEGDVHGEPPSVGEASDASEAALVAQAVVELSERRSAARSGRKPPPEPTNINTGGFEDLQRLPRVGPAMAARIIAYRQEVGHFRRPEDIMEVRGIGERTFEQMAPWIRL